MMIGPEPITSTDFDVGRASASQASLRGSDHRGRQNRSNRYAASCGPAAASGWYCTEKRLQPPVGVAQLEPLDDVVVEADVADRGDAVRRLRRRVERGVDREPVVVRGHLDLAGGAVHHRLVDAAVAVLELVGAEARARGRRAGCRSRSRSRAAPASSAPCSSSTWSGGRGRVARAVGEEQPVRARTASTSSRVAVAGSTCTSMPRSAIIRGVFALMPEVERGDREPLRSPTGGHDVRLGRRDLAGQLGAGHLRGGQHPLAAGVGSVSVSVEIPTRIAPRSRRWRVSARVSTPLMPTTPWARSSSSSERTRAPARRDPRGVAHDVAADPDPATTPGPRR